MDLQNIMETVLLVINDISIAVLGIGSIIITGSVIAFARQQLNELVGAQK